ncbi:hypothetical protein, conserved [Eimeria acervulina]|uniref:Uncharacterized protein n=1 Tax=Eimeria acervulina TaxID=5801 RepID=U6GCT2_EIMAC|nr:hypothetical protein, conserved [Eimeria acervulina]CDI77357.1 hypothetical protein, conserved [Eimeria acervulina]
MAQITGSALTIYHSQVLKKSAENSWLFLYGRSKTIDFRMPSTFFWEGVDVPVKATEDSPNCGTVHPRQQPGTLPMLHLPQVFHSTTEVLSRFSAPLHRLLVIVGLTVSGCGYQGLQFSCLINGILSALSEAWFCRHMGLKGEHIVFDAQKFAKDAAQQSDEPAITKAAVDISEKAQKVTSTAKEATGPKHEGTAYDEEMQRGSEEDEGESDPDEENTNEENRLDP